MFYYGYVIYLVYSKIYFLYSMLRFSFLCLEYIKYLYSLKVKTSKNVLIREVLLAPLFPTPTCLPARGSCSH